MEQRSDEWFKARAGKVTASRISDVVAKTKTGYGASRANYMAQIIADRLSGEPQSTFTNAAMQWGTETEPMARAAYEFEYGVDVAEVGFLVHPEIEMAGASPDGIIGDDGLIEIKCPNTATHIETLTKQEAAKKYIDQMQWQMACTGTKWCDFVSFDPRMPPELNMFVKRVEYDEERVRYLEEEVLRFLEEVDDKISKLKQLYGS
jgi:putative phage-type endonuclease